MKGTLTHFPPFFSKPLVDATAIVCAGAFALASTFGPTATAATRPGVGSDTGAAKCATSELVVWLDTQAQGALGTEVYSLKFTNLSRRACTLAGYPRVSAVRLGGRQIGRAASRYRLTWHTVSLASGATATALLFVREIGTFKTPCRAVTAAGLRVYPPGGSTPQTIPFPFGACSTPQNDVSVGPVRSA